LNNKINSIKFCSCWYFPCYCCWIGSGYHFRFWNCIWDYCFFLYTTNWILNFLIQLKKRKKESKTLDAWWDNLIKFSIWTSSVIAISNWWSSISFNTISTLLFFFFFFFFFFFEFKIIKENETNEKGRNNNQIKEQEEEKEEKKKRNEPVLSPEVVGGQYALSSTTERHCTSNILKNNLMSFFKKK